MLLRAATCVSSAGSVRAGVFRGLFQIEIWFCRVGILAFLVLAGFSFLPMLADSRAPKHATCGRQQRERKREEGREIPPHDVANISLHIRRSGRMVSTDSQQF